MLLKVFLFCAPFCLSSRVQMQLSFQPIGEQKRGVCVPFGKKKTTRKENTTTMMRRVFRKGGGGGVLVPGFLSWGGGAKRCSHSFVGGFVGIPKTPTSWRRGGILVSTFASSSSVESIYGRSSLNSSADERKKSLVIVESPAKAKTIENYLGKDYLSLIHI